MPCKCIGPVDITVYRIPTSREGYDVKSYFDRKGVRYEDMDVQVSPQALEKMKQLSGQTTRPVIVINDRVFVGFDPEELDHFVPSFF
ncbi:MAG TPA: glutaredoxin family protein [Anaerolineaceae bacterium]|nr:glutaredoxin family protein [Anaerolineaceae bacterium]